jgi:hypothetical protein
MSGFWQALMGRWLDEGRFLIAFTIIASAYAFGIFAFVGKDTSTLVIIGDALALVVAMTTLRTLSSFCRLRGSKSRGSISLGKLMVSHQLIRI